MITLSRTQKSLDAELSRQRVLAIAAVNARMSEVRSLYITTIAGQEMIYAAKEAEAAEFLSLPTPPLDLTNFPFIAHEVGTSTGATAQQVAQTFSNMAAIWRTLGAELEQLRIATKDAITIAGTAAGIDATVAQFQTTIEPYSNP